MRSTTRLPAALEAAVKRANSDQKVRAIILAGAGRSFCTGYDLNYYAQFSGTNPGIQEMPWDAMKDFSFMQNTTSQIMSVWRSHLPVICKLQGYAVAGGSDIALCADLLVMG